jgi:hypothetical protein
LKFRVPLPLSFAAQNPLRVGFDDSFGVKLAGLWAVEGDLPPVL